MKNDTYPIDIVPLSDWGFKFKFPYVISGPCSAETEEQMLQTAQALSSFPIDTLRAGIWKPRTSPHSFEGIGEKGLTWLKKAGQAAGLPVAVEIAHPEHVHACLEHDIDILWIGARTTVSPFAVQALAYALEGVDIPVWVKNPVCPEIDLWIGAMERLNNAGIRRLGALHRGFSSFEQTDYRNQPGWAIPKKLKELIPHLPLLCDPSHMCGKVDLIDSTIQQAFDLNIFDGFMIESHIDPQNALSDSNQQVTPFELGELLSKYKKEKVKI